MFQKPRLANSNLALLNSVTTIWREHDVVFNRFQRGLRLKAYARGEEIRTPTVNQKGQTKVHITKGHPCWVGWCCIGTRGSTRSWTINRRGRLFRDMDNLLFYHRADSSVLAADAPLLYNLPRELSSCISRAPGTISPSRYNAAALPWQSSQRI